jgi:hypothetical protein
VSGAGPNADTLSSGPPEGPERVRRDPGSPLYAWLRPGLLIPVVVAALLGLTAGYIIGLNRSTAPVDPSQTTLGSIRLRATDGQSELTDLGNKIVELQLVIENEGRSPVRIRSAGASSPGLLLFQTTYFIAEGISAPPPADIDPGGSITVIFSYRVTVCAAALASRPRMPVEVDTRNGARVTSVAGTEPFLNEMLDVIGSSRAC